MFSVMRPVEVGNPRTGGDTTVTLSVFIAAISLSLSGQNVFIWSLQIFLFSGPLDVQSLVRMV